MKSPLLFIALFVFGLTINFAQTSANNRVSPLDSVETKVHDVEIGVIYSRPFLKGREFGKDIVPFGKVWRTGANEATIFQTNKDILVEGKVLPAGKYSLYTIPNESETIVIFNKDWDQWGTKYDESRDALRVSVPTHFVEDYREQFTIDIDDAGAACLAWGKALFAFHINPA
jgi:hypothetical protein